MPDGELNPRVSPPVAGIATLAAIVILWFARDVMTVDVVLRLALPALWLTVWSLACLGAGWPVVVLLLARAGPIRVQLVVVLAAGAAVLALVGSVLALIGLFDRHVLGLILLAATIAGPLVVWRHRSAIEWLPAGLLSPVTALVLVPAGATLIVLSTPPVMYDVLHYHLAFPEQWLIQGGFVEFSRESFSYYASAHGTLFAFALSTIGPWGANAVNWWMAALATVAAATLGERLGGPRAGAWAAACFVCTPATLEIAGYAIADHVVAGWAGAALIVLLSGERRPPEPGRVALAAALAASAAAAKYLALATVLAPIALVTMVLGWRATAGRTRRRAALALVFVAAASIPLAPWLGRNLAWTGNPVYPYFTELFGGPPSELDMATEIGRNLDLPESVAGRAAAAFGALAWRTFSPRVEGGLLGPHWLFLLPLAAMVAGLRPGMRTALWTATLAGLLAWGCLVQYPRFLLPALVPGAALAGAAAAALTRGIGRASRIAFTALLVATLAWNASVLASRLNLDRLAVVTGRLSENDFRARWFDAAPVVDFAARVLPATAHVLLVGEARSFGLARRVLVEDPYRMPLLVELVSRSPSPARLAEAVRTLGATHILVNQNEMPRFARVRKVPDYFFGASEEQRAVIAAFLENHVERLFTHDGVWIARITEVRPLDTDRGGTASTDSAGGQGTHQAR